MTVAKGRLFVSAEQLQALLQLPDGVEILALKPKATEDGFEFLLVSENETELTQKGTTIGRLPRVDLELNYVEGLVEQKIPFPEVHRKGQAEIIFDDLGGVTINGKPVSFGQPVSEKPEVPFIKKDVKDSFKDILNRKGIF